jgi:hypothetical protein
MVLTAMRYNCGSNGLIDLLSSYSVVTLARRVRVCVLYIVAGILAHEPNFSAVLQRMLVERLDMISLLTLNTL